MLDDYSEWKLVDPHFEQVVMNPGFQSRDFQNNQRSGSVIDPEVFGKLRSEAIAIRTNMRRRDAAFASCLIPYWLAVSALMVTLTSGPFFLDLPPWLQPFLFYGGFVVLFFYIPYRSEQKAVDKLTALAESYQPFFLKAYGMEMGYNKFKGFRQLRLGVSCLGGIYLRSPRRPAVDEEVPMGGGNMKQQEDGHGVVFPPIYILPLIPGDLHIQEKGYDADFMKVDAETWALLQSTHQEKVKRALLLDTILLVLCATGLWYTYHWFVGEFSPPKVGEPSHYGDFLFRTVLFVVWLFICCLVILPRALDYRQLRVYEKVTKVVNKYLQQEDKKNDPQLTIEFCASKHPGRDGNRSRRYQFVQCALPTAAAAAAGVPTNEMGIGSSWEKGMIAGEQDGLRGRTRKE